jgi:hypothetical protein
VGVAKSVQLGVANFKNRGTAEPGQDQPQQIWPNFKNSNVQVMSRGVLAVSRWCPVGVPVMSPVVFFREIQCPGGVLVVSQKCPDDVPTVS